MIRSNLLTRSARSAQRRPHPISWLPPENPRRLRLATLAHEISKAIRRRHRIRKVAGRPAERLVGRLDERRSRSLEGKSQGTRPRAGDVAMSACADRAHPALRCRDRRQQPAPRGFVMCCRSERRSRSACKRLSTGTQGRRKHAGRRCARGCSSENAADDRGSPPYCAAVFVMSTRRRRAAYRRRQNVRKSRPHARQTRSSLPTTPVCTRSGSSRP